MPEKTSPKTMQSTTNTTTATNRVGSDEDMRSHGFHPSSQSEIAQYGKFLNREGFFSMATGVVRRYLPQLGKTNRAEIVVVSAWQSEGSNPLPGHQSLHQLGTRQSEATSTAVFREESGQYRRTHLAGPVLECLS
jgi:hypothetical protein